MKSNIESLKFLWTAPFHRNALPTRSCAIQQQPQPAMTTESTTLADCTPICTAHSQAPPDTCPQAPSHQLQPLARETLSPSGYTGIQTPQVPSKIKRKEKGKTWSRWRFLGRWDAQPALQDQPPNTRGYAGFSKWNQDLPSWLGSISQENSRSNDSLKPHRVYSFLL